MGLYRMDSRDLHAKPLDIHDTTCYTLKSFL